MCDCARIAARDKLDVDQLVCEEFVTDLFSIVTHPQSNTSVMALRSLINLMNENTASYKIFTGEPLNGINGLITSLRHLILDNREPQIMFLSTKLLYMLQSQRYLSIHDMFLSLDYFAQSAYCNSTLLTPLMFSDDFPMCHDIFLCYSKGGQSGTSFTS